MEISFTSMYYLGVLFVISTIVMIYIIKKPRKTKVSMWYIIGILIVIIFGLSIPKWVGWDRSSTPL